MDEQKQQNRIYQVGVVTTSGCGHKVGVSLLSTVYIVSVVVGILMLIVLVALIVYVVYYFMTGSAAAASKAKLSAVFMQG